MTVSSSSSPCSAVEDSRTSTRRQLLTVCTAAAAVAVVPLAYLFTAPTGPKPPFIMLSLATAVFGTTVFIRHGGRTFTATGIYYLAVALFGGIAGLLTALYSRYTIDSATLAASTLLYLTSVLTYYLFLNGESTRSNARNRSRSRHLDKPVTLARPWLGPGALIVAFYLSFTNLPIGPLAKELAYCGVLLTAATLLSGRGRSAVVRKPSYMFLTAGALLGYVARFFSGYGRLNLATIALALTMLYTLARSSRHIKGRLLVAILPFLLIAGAIGATRTTFSTGDERSTYGVGGSGDVLATGSGLEGVMSPLARLSDLIRLDRSRGPLASEIGDANGETFLVALIPWLPRSWWPDKPYGFGRELAILLTPYDDLHSEAALTHGEWYYNFGYLGFILMVPLHGVALSWLDRLMLSQTARGRRSSNIPVRSLVPVVLAAGLADYVWMGAFTYMSRAGLRAAILAGFVILIERTRPVSAPLAPRLIRTSHATRPRSDDQRRP
jgi:hypothetical protein